jgi:hypothetical protein
MAIQFEMEIAHAVRRVGRGDGGAINEMLGWDERPFEIEAVIGRYGERAAGRGARDRRLGDGQSSVSAGERRCG